MQETEEFGISQTVSVNDYFAQKMRERKAGLAAAGSSVDDQVAETETSRSEPVDSDGVKSRIEGGAAGNEIDASSVDESTSEDDVKTRRKSKRAKGKKQGETDTAEASVEVVTEESARVTSVDTEVMKKGRKSRKANDEKKGECSKEERLDDATEAAAGGGEAEDESVGDSLVDEGAARKGEKSKKGKNKKQPAKSESTLRNASEGNEVVDEDSVDVATLVGEGVAKTRRRSKTAKGEGSSEEDNVRDMAEAAVNGINVSTEASTGLTSADEKVVKGRSKKSKKAKGKTQDERSSEEDAKQDMTEALTVDGIEVQKTAGIATVDDEDMNKRRKSKKAKDKRRNEQSSDKIKVQDMTEANVNGIEIVTKESADVASVNGEVKKKRKRTKKTKDKKPDEQSSGENSVQNMTEATVNGIAVVTDESANVTSVNGEVKKKRKRTKKTKDKKPDEQSSGENIVQNMTDATVNGIAVVTEESANVTSVNGEVKKKRKRSRRKRKADDSDSVDEAINSYSTLLQNVGLEVVMTTKEYMSKKMKRRKVSAETKELSNAVNMSEYSKESAEGECVMAVSSFDNEKPNTETLSEDEFLATLCKKENKSKQSNKLELECVQSVYRDEGECVMAVSSFDNEKPNTEKLSEDEFLDTLCKKAKKSKRSNKLELECVQSVNRDEGECVMAVSSFDDEKPKTETLSEDEFLDTLCKKAKKSKRSNKLELECVQSVNRDEGECVMAVSEFDEEKPKTETLSEDEFLDTLCKKAKKSKRSNKLELECVQSVNGDDLSGTADANSTAELASESSANISEKKRKRKKNKDNCLVDLVNARDIEDSSTPIESVDADVTAKKTRRSKKRKCEAAAN